MDSYQNTFLYFVFIEVTLWRILSISRETLMLVGKPTHTWSIAISSQHGTCHHPTCQQLQSAIFIKFVKIFTQLGIKTKYKPHISGVHQSAVLPSEMQHLQGSQ